MKPLRVGVIGAGWWATEIYLPILKAHPQAELVALNRLGEAELEQVRQKFDVPNAFTDYRQMLASCALDAVIVASPHTLHFEHAMAALDHGAHVFVEKPMTTSAADARALAQWARQADKQLVVSLGWNFTSMAEHAQVQIAAGAVGEIRHVTLHMASALTDLFSGQGLLEAKDAFFRPASTTWADPGQAGGYGWGQLSHALGLLFQVTGLQPEEVFAVTGQSVAKVDLYDAAVVRFTNGATGALSGTATVPKPHGFQLDLRVFGTEGMLLLDIERERVEVRRHDGADVVMPVGPGEGAYPVEAALNTFIGLCLGSGKVNPAPGEVGVRTIEVLEALPPGTSFLMRLSITSWSFPACTLDEAIGIARALGIDAVDLGYFYRAALDKEAILANPDAAAERVRALPVAVPSLYHLFGASVADRNLADRANRKANESDFAKVVRFCRAAGIPTVFVLPGIVNPGQDHEAAMETSAASLGALADIATGEGVTLTIEPHVHSLLQSPAQTRELLDRTPGLKLTLDHAHFVCMGAKQEDIDALVPDAAHIHLRQARPGALQAKYHEGTIDFPALIGALARHGYAGSLAIEYVHQSYMNTLFDDVLTETVTIRDVVRTCLEKLP